MKPLTPAQFQILHAIKLLSRDGVCPSLKELADKLGFTSLATIHKHLRALEAKGYIRREFNKVRSIQIVKHKLKAGCPLCGRTS